MLVSAKNGVEYLVNPVGQVRVETVVNPLALASARQEPASPKLCQMP